MKVAVKEPNVHTLAQPPSGMVLQLLQKQPFIIWGASLVLVLLTGSIALRGLISPGPIEPDSPATSTAQTEKSAPAKPSPHPESAANAEVEQASNLWLFGAIGLGCAVGSLLIAKRLEQMEAQQTGRPTSQAEPEQASNTKTRKAKPAQAASRPGRQRKFLTRKGSARRVPVPTVTVAATPNPVSATPAPMADHSVTEPVVTVVPDHETHPLDWGDDSLADMMDIRKERPLSHWL